MRTASITIAATWLYDRPDSYALVTDPTTSDRVLVTRWGTYHVTEANNHFVRGIKRLDTQSMELTNE